MTAAVVLPEAYRGDSYAFSLLFPNASYLVGAPANVLAQIRTDTEAATIAATWTVVVDPTNAARLLLSLAAVTLAPDTYVTDVQVGTTTYLRKTAFRVVPDVSR